MRYTSVIGGNMEKKRAKSSLREGNDSQPIYEFVISYTITEYPYQDIISINRINLIAQNFK